MLKLSFDKQEPVNLGKTIFGRGRIMCETGQRAGTSQCVAGCVVSLACL